MTEFDATFPIPRSNRNADDMGMPAAIKADATITINAPVHGDPDLEVGGILTLERTDGRRIWRQRLVVTDILVNGGVRHYMVKPFL